jgi:hypothetical protein
LSYVFVGDLNHLTGLAPWDLFMKAGVLITCVALAGVFIGLRSDTSRGPSSMNWTLSGLAVAAISGTAFNSLAFSLPMAMMLFVLVHRFTAARPVIREFVLVISMVALVFTKTSTAVVVVIVLASILVFTERVKRFDNWTPVLILGATGTTMYLLVFRGASQLSALTLEWPNRNEALRAMWDLITSPDVVLQIFLWTFCVSQLPFAGLRQMTRQALPFGFLVTAALLGISLARTDALTGFVVSVLNFVTFWAILSWSRRRTGADAEQSPISSVTAILMMTIGFGIGAIFRRVLSQLNSLLPIEDLLGSAIWDGVHRSAYLIAVLCFLLFLTLTPRFRGMHRTYLACILLTLGMLGGADRARFIDASTLGPDPLQNWRGGNSAPFPDNDLQIVGRWIRENTPIDIVLASNNFCCPGSDWWYDIVANLDNYKQDPDETVGDPVLEPSFGGDNYLIPAETRRRFYMQGLGHQPIPLGGTISAEQVSRMTASLEFANQPTETVANQLKSGGVSGFVVNLALTQHRDWSQFAEERFRFGNFAYLELR